MMLEDRGAARGRRVSLGASPRGTFLKIAKALRLQIKDDPNMVELPSVDDIMSEYEVSRGVVLRSFAVLHHEGLAEPVPGSRWQVTHRRHESDRQPLAKRLIGVFQADALEVGATFPSATSLCQRFGVSRPTVSKALGQLEAAGLLTEARQGKPRTVLALPAPDADSTH